MSASATSSATSSASASESSSASASPSVGWCPESHDGECGPDNGGTRCPSSEACCSAYGYCGTDADYCGVGCQPFYSAAGSCYDLPPTPSRTPHSLPSAAPTATALPCNVIAPGTTVYQCSIPGTVAITFDDGPFAYTRAIVDMLNAAGMKATFFQNGNNWDCIYNHWRVIQFIDASGHQIACHTYSHADLTRITQKQVSSEMTLLSPVYSSIIGKVPLFMRPPYGASNAAVTATLESLGYIVVVWTQDSGDAEGATLQQSQDTYEGLGYTHPGATAPYANGSSWIFLNHDVQIQTWRNLTGWVIDWVRRRGLRAVTVAECLGVTEAYREYTAPLSDEELTALEDNCPTRPAY